MILLFAWLEKIIVNQETKKEKKKCNNNIFLMME